MAVLRLETPLPEFHNTIEPAILNNVTIPVASQCRLAAWGSATAAVNAPLQPELRTLNAPVIDSIQCNAANVHAGGVLATHICAGSLATTNPASGACNGETFFNFLKLILKVTLTQVTLDRVFTVMIA